MITLPIKEIHRLQKIVYDKQLQIKQSNGKDMTLREKVLIVFNKYRCYLTLDDFMRVLFIDDGKKSQLYAILKQLVCGKQVRLTKENKVKKFKLNTIRV
ncbi:MAG: hypothetical protein MJ069_09945 [Salinivirgaceae bacterium]|nr:hypothetical protein [Salinivirgaceae bacterium]